MFGKGGVLFIFILVFSAFLFSSVSAVDNFTNESSREIDILKDLEGEFSDAELEVDPGITPDSPFYFLDGIFGDSREEKIAEVKKMIEKGDFESARKALLKYMEYAKEFKDNPDPEKRDEARRAASSIHRMLEKIKSEIPEEEREEFYEDVLDSEGSIVTAVEISGKIKELCIQLAELDPLEYSKMCRTDDDAPRWQKRLDRDLSEEQEKIAKDFVRIMKQCFETSGQDCACEEIPFYDFSIACSKAAPLATACDIEGDEIACDELDNLKMPELPEWLESIWEELDEGMSEAQYDMHMPRECVEAGVTDPRECGKVMINAHTPIECRAALLKANVQSEREGREICEKIMMEQHAPDCVEKGIEDPAECARFMDGFRGPIEGESNFGPNCMEIEDPMERLDCYDHKGDQMGEYYGPTAGEMPEGEITWQCKENRIHWPPDCETFMREEWPEMERQRMEEGDFRREQEYDWRVLEKECADSCDLENGWWDFRGGECVCYTDERSFEDRSFEDYGGEDYIEGGSCGDCASECEERDGQRLRATDCVNGNCECYYESDEPQYAEGEGPASSGEEEGDTITEGENSESTSGDTTGTGMSITGNAFLDYYFR